MSTSSAASGADPPFGRVSILGLGLMGGSLGRALAELPRPPELVGWCPDAEDRRAAAGSGAFDEVAGRRADALAGADLVVLAAPLSASLALLAAAAEEAPAGATITDVVSLKRPVADAARAAGVGARWVGSHPMTGAEASGFAASRAELYVGATVWTVADGAPPERVDAVHRVWRAVGAEPVATEAGEHDRLMALVSHLPQLAANALAAVLERRGVSEAQLGPGGRDATRLAASSPTMWRDLLAHAPAEVAEGLRALGAESERLAALLEAGDTEELARVMGRTALWRSGG